MEKAKEVFLIPNDSRHYQVRGGVAKRSEPPRDFVLHFKKERDIQKAHFLKSTKKIQRRGAEVMIIINSASLRLCTSALKLLTSLRKHCLCSLGPQECEKPLSLFLQTIRVRSF